MQDIELFYSLYPFWTWLAAGAALLALETATGSGYLLWPALAAGLVALLTLGVHLGPSLETVIFAVLTIGLTYLARRYWPPQPRVAQPDLNDRNLRLLGRYGETVGDFSSGQGRVFVDGAEWTAELDAEPDLHPAPGARVRVIEVVDGGRLRVRAA
jgi:membrane protein implicated in regulation of membrane protease activity